MNIARLPQIKRRFTLEKNDKNNVLNKDQTYRHANRTAQTRN